MRVSSRNLLWKRMLGGEHESMSALLRSIHQDEAHLDYLVTVQTSININIPGFM